MVPGIYEEVFEQMNPFDERQLLWAKPINNPIKGLFFPFLTMEIHRL